MPMLLSQKEFTQHINKHSSFSVCNDYLIPTEQLEQRVLRVLGSAKSLTALQKELNFHWKSKQELNNFLLSRPQTFCVMKSNMVWNFSSRIICGKWIDQEIERLLKHCKISTETSAIMPLQDNPKDQKPFFSVEHIYEKLVETWKHQNLTFQCLRQELNLKTTSNPNQLNIRCRMKSGSTC